MSMQYNIQNPQYLSMFCVKVCEEEKEDQERRNKYVWDLKIGKLGLGTGLSLTKCTWHN